MARRSDHSKEEITEMALAAAEKLADEKGYAGLSARKIAGEIGYTVGTLYLVFKNLDDLVLSVNARTLDKLKIHIGAKLENCSSPRNCVNIMGRAYIEFAKQFPNRWNMIFEHRIPDDVPVPIWYESRVEHIFELIEYHLAPMLKGYNEQQLAQIARTLWCGVHGICVLGMTKKLRIVSSEAIENLTELLINNFLSGLSVKVDSVTSVDRLKMI